MTRRKEKYRQTVKLKLWLGCQKPLKRKGRNMTVYIWAYSLWIDEIGFDNQINIAQNPKNNKVWLAYDVSKKNLRKKL